ncbi:SusD/RagB family nutrient-binding outer membrane lipoprotein [Sphingobacterium rhinopitheci]|uniref:SusD/RagB family nutrient-binding outer membrane lipoprotein n=1 Tax=Sphingobacterium rhinopitheci TaxID=2781960 RepID=UPI001F51A6A8|nr:SusD/RagB family nutrient-binding outer membrane lipoprotein [Sphingobacterium rhinopitheci]MCI0920086.1 SusD/RagB family nutrient-binding outer membrane lipoprotein [Sphingobacterium rhinopitheci]
MKAFIKSTILCTALSISLSSCTKDFVKINTNPNESTAVAPQSLLGPAIYSVITANLDRNFRINNEFMQVTVTRNDNREFHRYEVRATETEYMWKNWYLQLTNIRDIYNKAEIGRQTGYQTYQGISLILDAWVTSLLTDTYGDIPYFESNLGYTNNNTTPYFDNQIDIYRDILLKLERANELLKENVAVESGNNGFDPIYGSDPTKWRKLGNSLYLRLLLRTSHKPELNSVEKIKEIVDNNPAEYPIMNSNDESAILKFISQEPYLNPFYNARDLDFNGDKGYSEFFINNLLELGDPRLSIWATEATLGVYGGIESGYPKGSIPELQSRFQLTLKGPLLPGIIMSYPELLFILAELGERGIIQKNAIDYYNKGVQSSIEMWGATVPVNYFDNPKVAIQQSDSQTTILKKIHLQKYYTLMFTDFQQWFEYRRTGFLDLYTGVSLQNDGKMPVRLSYPLITQSLNKANYETAISRIGGDKISSQMWWQVGIN